jgi:hypothetical protein
MYIGGGGVSSVSVIKAKQDHKALVMEEIRLDKAKSALSSYQIIEMGVVDSSQHHNSTLKLSE